MLAEQRRAGDVARGVRQLDRVADRDVLAAGRMIDLGRDADRAQRLVVVRIRARYPRLQVSVRRSALIEEDPDEFDIGISMRLVDGPRKAPDDGRILIARESVLSRTAYLRPPPLILSLSQSSAIRAGRHAMMTFERVGQGREVAETGGERNFGNREVTPPQGFSGPQQPALDQIAIRRPLRRSPKGADEVIGRQSGQGRKVGKTDFRGEIGLDIVEDEA